MILICSQPKNGTVLKVLKVRNSRRNKVLKSQTVIYYRETYFLSLRTGSLSIKGFSNPLRIFHRHMLGEVSKKWLCKDEAKLIQLEGCFIVVDTKLPQ